VTAGELRDWPEADPLLRERIVRLHRRIKKLSAFDLLGVPAEADSGTVRRAFTVASKELHPDRYFAKNLGSFKPRLAAIFARLSEAMQEIEDEQKGKR
jgi:curved DNA-binding protein CbpA